jgi:hypothetical protein
MALNPASSFRYSRHMSWPCSHRPKRRKRTELNNDIYSGFLESPNHTVSMTIACEKSAGFVSTSFWSLFLLSSSLILAAKLLYHFARARIPPQPVGCAPIPFWFASIARGCASIISQRFPPERKRTTVSCCCENGPNVQNKESAGTGGSPSTGANRQ